MPMSGQPETVLETHQNQPNTKKSYKKNKDKKIYLLDFILILSINNWKTFYVFHLLYVEYYLWFLKNFKNEFSFKYVRPYSGLSPNANPTLHKYANMSDFCRSSWWAESGVLKPVKLVTMQGSILWGSGLGNTGLVWSQRSAM